MLENASAESPAKTAPCRESPALGDPPVDLVHLSRQCQGDPGLEEELLGLFARLSAPLVAQMSDPHTGLERKADIAHKLRGSAMAIGAGRVARAAEAIEAMARSAPGGDRPGDEQEAAASRAVAALRAAVVEAVGQIERLLR